MSGDGGGSGGGGGGGNGEAKTRTFDIDDGVDRDNEFENFEAERQKELEHKAKKTEEEKVSKEKARDKEGEKQHKNQDTVLLWAPTLITAPLLPGGLAMLTAAIGTVVAEWHYIDFLSPGQQGPCVPLLAYVIGEVVMSYLFLGVYMTLLIGPQVCARACGTTTLLFAYWIVFGVVFLGLNCWGAYNVATLDIFCFNDASLIVKTDDTVRADACVRMCADACMRVRASACIRATGLT